MVTHLSYSTIVKAVLQEHATYRAQMPDAYSSVVVFDEVRGRYLVLDWGWSGEKYLHTTPIHVDIIEGRVWIQWDDTEEGIASELVAAGIPAVDIVLGFRHPELRQFTGFGGARSPVEPVAS